MSKDFSKSVIDVIKYRTSIRTYDNNSLSKELKNKLENHIGSVAGPFDENVNLQIIDKDDKSNESVKLGTYGVIKGAKSFILAAIKNNSEALLNLGYILEDVILYATKLGVGTVWLGGTFNRGEFAKVANITDDEILPIVVPIGIPAEKRSITEKMMRFVSGGQKRKNFNEIFFYENFEKSLDETKAGDYVKPLEMVRLAPSASNKQPWRILMTSDSFYFFLSHAKGYQSMGFDIQKIDIGIAMYHFEVTAKELNLKGHWTKEKENIKNVPPETEFIIRWIKD